MTLYAASMPSEIAHHRYSAKAWTPGAISDAEAPVPMAIGVEWRGESYGLLIDQIGEVLTLPAAWREPAPGNLDVRLARVAAGVHLLDDRLLTVLDVDRVIEGAAENLAA